MVAPTWCRTRALRHESFACGCTHMGAMMLVAHCFARNLSLLERYTTSSSRLPVISAHGTHVVLHGTCHCIAHCKGISCDAWCTVAFSRWQTVFKMPLANTCALPHREKDCTCCMQADISLLKMCCVQHCGAVYAWRCTGGTSPRQSSQACQQVPFMLTN